jgi:hypothetical protein
MSESQMHSILFFLIVSCRYSVCRVYHILTLHFSSKTIIWAESWLAPLPPSRISLTIVIFTYHLYLSQLPLLNISRDSTVSAATVYWMDDWGAGVRVPVESRIFFSPKLPDRFWGPASYQNGTGIKRPGPDSNHWPTESRASKHGSIHPVPHTDSWRSA